MQKENEKSEALNQNSSEKINYSIKTMGADLKNEGFANSSFDLKKETVTKEEKIEEIEVKEVVPRKEVPNPFLKDLKSTSENIYNQPPNKTFQAKESDKATLKPLSPILEKNSDNQPFLNSKLLIVLLFISLTAVCAGVFYFYSTQKADSTLPVAETPPEIVSPKISVIEIPEKLKNSEIITLETETNLTSLLLEQKVLLPNNPGNYYEIKKDELPISATELLTLLDIQFPEEVLAKLEASWVFLYSQENILKMSLILKIKEKSTEPASFLENNEYRLPELLKPLFIDETFVLQDEPIVFQGSGIIEDVRYYNFAENTSDKSIDWGIANNEYLILATSKETALKLMEDLTTEENLSETSNQLEAETPSL